jgi:hypothetical protein
MAYALAFEETYLDDDWTRLAQYFTVDALYEVRGGPLACTLNGRDAIFRGIKKSLNGLDRRCDTRRVELTGAPDTTTDAGGARVSIGWKASYERGTGPDLIFAGRSVATVVDDRIVHLYDEYTEAEMASVTKWMLEHGAGLDGSYV